VRARLLPRREGSPPPRDDDDTDPSQCADYQVQMGVPLPSRPAPQHRNPLHGLHMLKATGAISDDRRCCMDCAALIHPSLTKRVSPLPFQLNFAHVPLDVCFVFDATASMVNFINLVEREIEW